ncbi:MAG: SDR family oxidoreductase [Candidatus Saccharibacteria bacterium]|nr:SDR family oxidoreductase [Candidatus Saccharibacteria bacterium]
MKVAVLGASGKSGRAFVAAALAAGHEVTAGVRRQNPFKEQPNLRVVTCDVTIKDQLSATVMGQDAVVSLLGHVRGTPANMQTDAMKLLAEVMEQAGVKRLVSLTGSGARQPDDIISLIDRVMNASIGLIDPKRIQDGVDYIKVLQSSALNWTVIRVLKLTNQKAGNFTLTEHGPAKTFISRASVAQAILQVLSDQSYIKQCPVLSS